MVHKKKKLLQLNGISDYVFSSIDRHYVPGISDVFFNIEERGDSEESELRMTSFTHEYYQEINELQIGDYDDEIDIDRVLQGDFMPSDNVLRHVYNELDTETRWK